MAIERSPLLSARRLEMFLRHPLSQVAAGYLAVWFIGINFALLKAAAVVHWNDFGKFYYAVVGWQGGSSLYAPSIATRLSDAEVAIEFLDMNPPHFHIILLPLMKLTVSQAARVWLVVNLAGAVLFCGLAARELGIRVRKWQWLPLIAFTLISTATAANSVTAQCTGVLMPLITVAWINARHGRWVSSGIWLGVLASIKPFLGLFLIAFAIRRRWRAIVGMCVGGAFCGLVGVVVFGLSAYWEWLDALSKVSWVWVGMNGSLQALMTKLLSHSPASAPVLNAPSLITPLWAIGVTFVCIWSVRALSWSVDHLFAVTVLASLVISPLGWVYYLWLAFPPCLALWNQRASALTVFGLLYQCFPLWNVTIGQPHAIATILFACAYAWSTLLLWLDVSSFRRTTSMSPALAPARASEPSAISTTA